MYLSETACDLPQAQSVGPQGISPEMPTDSHTGLERSRTHDELVELGGRYAAVLRGRLLDGPAVPAGGAPAIA